MNEQIQRMLDATNDGKSFLKETQLGEMHAASFVEDPKHLGFVLARYKFVARMLGGYRNVLEVGCGDTTGARVVRPVVGYLAGIDVVEYPHHYIPTQQWDMIERPYPNTRTGGWHAIYALDVLEHIETKDESAFLGNIAKSLLPSGVFICGTPSLEGQRYASPNSVREHVNCKTEDGLRHALGLYFDHVFMFGMNDETLHTGFGPMCHYRLAVCVRAG